MRVDADAAGGRGRAGVRRRAGLARRIATGIRDAPTPMRDEFAQGLRRDWIALVPGGVDNRVMGRRPPGRDRASPAGRSASSSCGPRSCRRSGSPSTPRRA
ncbi:MAG: hypothetical protein MZV64_28210 [Ignavibacteriales bacterium]|nr:hypothetical protein [Ignavibacteriales bacterium]